MGVISSNLTSMKPAPEAHVIAIFRDVPSSFVRDNIVQWRYVWVEEWRRLWKSMNLEDFCEGASESLGKCRELTIGIVFPRICPKGEG